MKTRLLTILGTAAVALAAATVAFGAPLTTTATITGTGGISMSLPSSPSISNTLDGTDQITSWSALLGIVDATGSGFGWNLTASATTFSDGSGHTLAPGTLTGVTSACQAGNTCTSSTNAVSYPIVLNGTAAKFFNSALNTGLGKFNVTPSVAVAIPGNAYAGTYTSTVTLAAVSGP
jgi:hypothetical protein